MSFIAVIAAARPNFMKVDPLLRALDGVGLPSELVHTGQHYDQNMSEVFFQELQIRKPDVDLGVGSGTHAVQTAGVMVEFEKYCFERKPSWVVVAGDVNSTVACALVAAKLGINVAHLEAGLRSFDWEMPEEINRVVTDRLSDVLLTPSPDGDENLLKEGVPAERIFRVGNIMIDTLMRLLPRAKESTIHSTLGIEPGHYLLGTLHRPSNVDSQESLARLVGILEQACKWYPFVLPVHPRTRQKLKDYGLQDRLEGNDRIHLLDPLGYLDFLSLSSQARAVLTDSGGIQEETTVLGIPCLTLRENTERPITITQGTNTLVGSDETKILSTLESVLAKDSLDFSVPELWDGKTGERCAQVLKEQF
ncbi:MAG: UDP-N-acetylglucosamine 2-epimerase (non-hydrolyzing) [Bdellovibrionales bacterium]|nr:UDP-N-acetylglucosamine 2-epimerase (non-hydrolyzing) [Bdellovibrionales bacterium]